MDNNIDKITAFKNRTKKFCIEVIYLFRSLPKTDEARIIGKQLIRSATSVAANYRAVCRARSEAERFSKLCIVVEEADESLFWLEILIEAKIVNHQQTEILRKEAEEITKIVNAIRHKLKKE